MVSPYDASLAHCLSNVDKEKMLENLKLLATAQISIPLTNEEITDVYAHLCISEQLWSTVVVSAIPDEYIGSAVAVNLVFSKDDKAALITKYFRWDLPILKHSYLIQAAPWIQEFLIDYYNHPEGSFIQKTFTAMDTWQLTMAELKEIVLNYIQKSNPQDLRNLLHPLSAQSMGWQNGATGWPRVAVGGGNTAAGGQATISGLTGVISSQPIFKSPISTTIGITNDSISTASIGWVRTILTKVGL